MGTEPLLCLWGQILLRNLKGRIKGAVLDEQVCERVKQLVYEVWIIGHVRTLAEVELK